VIYIHSSWKTTLLLNKIIVGYLKRYILEKVTTFINLEKGVLFFSFLFKLRIELKKVRRKEFKILELEKYLKTFQFSARPSPDC